MQEIVKARIECSLKMLKILNIEPKKVGYGVFIAAIYTLYFTLP